MAEAATALKSTSGKVVAVSTVLTLITIILYGSRVIRLFNTANKTLIVPNIGIDASTEGLVITARPIVKNPTKDIFEIDHPFCKVSLNDKEKTLLGSSDAQNKKYTIIANGQTQVDEVRILIQWQKVPALIQAAKTGVLDLLIETSTGAHLDTR